jgi:hypothetical protein
MKHELLDWAEYELLRSNLAKYKNTLLKHEPEKDLTNAEINDIISSYIYGSSYIDGYLNILSIMSIQTRKDSSNMFYRRIMLVGKPMQHLISSKLYLLDPSTMPKKNIIDSIFSWVRNGEIYCGDKSVDSRIIGLSKEDIEEYETILDNPLLGQRISKLKYGVDYTNYQEEM